MRTRENVAVDAMAATACLANEAAARGLRPAVQLAGRSETTGGWLLIEGAGDSLYVDEFGDLWWGRASGTRSARITRACWPEERTSLSAAIKASVNSILYSRA